MREKTDAIGLSQKIFNSQAVALADLNGDGKLDLIMNNEGQDSAVLFGNKELAGGKHTQVVVQMGAESVGSRLRMLNKEGKAVAMLDISGGEARGGQPSLSPRFTLLPGQYKLEIRTASGKSATQDVIVADAPLRVRLDGKVEQGPVKK